MYKTVRIKCKQRRVPIDELRERRIKMSEKKEIVFDDDADRLMSIEEVAKRLRTSPSFVSDLIDSGLLRALRFRKNRRIRKITFNKFLEDNDGLDLYDLLESMGKALKTS